MKYDVFGRVDPGDDLVAIGNLDAPNDRLARAYAHTTYDEEDWETLLVVRQEHLLDATDSGELPDTPGEPQ